jgi:hypothetical protein
MWHAICAAKIATVSQRDAHIAVGATEGVDQLGHALFTHSEVPSAKTWYFQIGNSSLTTVTISSHAAKAGPRWTADTTTAKALSPIGIAP